MFWRNKNYRNSMVMSPPMLPPDSTSAFNLITPSAIPLAFSHTSPSSAFSSPAAAPDQSLPTPLGIFPPFSGNFGHETMLPHIFTDDHPPVLSPADPGVRLSARACPVPGSDEAIFMASVPYDSLVGSLFVHCTRGSHTAASSSTPYSGTLAGGVTNTSVFTVDAHTWSPVLDFCRISVATTSTSVCGRIVRAGLAR